MLLAGHRSPATERLSPEHGRNGRVRDGEFRRQQFIPGLHTVAGRWIWLGIAPVAQRKPRACSRGEERGSGREFCHLDALEYSLHDLQCANVAFRAIDSSLTSGGATIGAASSQPDGKSLTGISPQSNSQTRVSEILCDELRAAGLAFRRETHSPSNYDQPMPPVSAAIFIRPGQPIWPGALKSGELRRQRERAFPSLSMRNGVPGAFSAMEPPAGFDLRNWFHYQDPSTGLMLAQMWSKERRSSMSPSASFCRRARWPSPMARRFTAGSIWRRAARDWPPCRQSHLTNMDIPTPITITPIFAFIASTVWANPARVSSPFGSLGFGLLGGAIGQSRRHSYPALLNEEIADPLGLRNTIPLSPEQQLSNDPGHASFTAQPRPGVRMPWPAAG